MDILLRGSDIHSQFHLGQGQERHRLSPGLTGTYGKDKLHRRTFPLERSRFAIARGCRRIWKILTTFLHPVTCHVWEGHRQVVKGFYC